MKTWSHSSKQRKRMRSILTVKNTSTHFSRSSTGSSRKSDMNFPPVLICLWTPSAPTSLPAVDVRRQSSWTHKSGGADTSQVVTTRMDVAAGTSPRPVSLRYAQWQQHEAKIDWHSIHNVFSFKSKIGAVLHVQFTINNKQINIDVDLNPPNIPTRNIVEYCGTDIDRKIFLENTRPVGWIEEWHKLKNLCKVVQSTRELRRSIRYL